MDFRLFLIMTLLGLMTSSCRSTDNQVRMERFERVKPDANVSVKPIEVIKNETASLATQISNIEYIQSRKVSLEFGVSGKIKNLQEYIANLNKRIVKAVIVSGRALDNGVLSCLDLSAPGEASEAREAKFQNDGNCAILEFSIDKDISSFEHKYSCAVFENGNLLDNSKKDFSFYKDIKIDSNLSKDVTDLQVGFAPNLSNKMGALVLMNNSKLLTNDHQLSIEAEEVVALEGSQITTFPLENLTAPNDTNGRSGGYISIKTAFVTGVLNVEMRGQNGGRVTTPIPSAITYLPTYNPTSLDGVKEIVSGPVGYCTSEGTCSFVYTTVTPPTSGLTSDQPGVKGKNGAAGFAGGSSGVFELLAKETHEDSFHFFAKVFNGKGSSGVNGGEGGPGIPGGKSGCSKFRNQVSCKYSTFEDSIGPWEKNYEDSIKIFSQRGCLPSGNTYCELHKEIVSGQVGSRGESGDRGLDGVNGAALYARFINIKDSKQNRKFNSFGEEN